MYRKLLVPLDGSAFSEQALPWAMHLARREGAALHLVYVHVPLAPVFADVRDGMETAPNLHLVQGEQDYLVALVKRLTETAPVVVTSAVLEGSVAEAIDEHVRATGVDLVVMTTHGRGAFSRFWLGSVADDLIHRLPLPVLLLRPGEKDPEATRGRSFRHVLIPLDGTAHAEQALDPALELGGPTTAQYTLFRSVTPIVQTAYDPGGFGVPPLALPTVAVLRAEAGNYLDNIAGPLRARGVHVETVVTIDAQPAVAILEAARNCSCDLIALETHGRKGLARFFLGSVADKVVRGATLPVLVHRTPIS